MHAEIGPNLFRAGVPSEHFEYYAAPSVAGRQRQSKWCWAASIQMVLNYHGLNVTQEQIVQRVFGGMYDAPANLNQISYALTGWAPDTRGRFSTIHATLCGLTPSQLITDLSNNWPLIVGLRGWPIGHACVLTTVEYTRIMSGFPWLTKAIYRDPWPGHFSRNEMLWQAFQLRTQYLIRVWVNRL